MVNFCKEMELQYTGKNIIYHFGQPHPKKISPDSTVIDIRREQNCDLMALLWDQ